ncbi:MAG: DUF885 family protein, partial [Hyphomonadaceae bacterium]
MHMTRRAMLGASSAVLALAACGRQTQSADVNSIFDRLSIDILRESPEYATSLGVSEAQAGGPYLNRLSDETREAKERYKQILVRGAADLRAVNREALSAQDRVSVDVVTTSFDNDVAVLNFAPGGGASTPYVVNQIEGAFTNIPDFLDSQHPVTNRAEAEAYLERLSGYARVLDQESAFLTEDAGAGTIPPDFAIDGAITQLQAFAGRAPAQTVLVQSFARRVGEIADIPDADKTAMRTRAEAITRDEVLPAYQRQIAALQAIRPRAWHDAGIWRQPNGAEMYAAAIKQQTTTDMSP